MCVCVCVCVCSFRHEVDVATGWVWGIVRLVASGFGRSSSISAFACRFELSSLLLWTSVYDFCQHAFAVFGYYGYY